LGAPAQSYQEPQWVAVKEEPMIQEDRAEVEVQKMDFQEGLAEQGWAARARLAKNAGRLEA
jgi:hypothetical protein